MPRSLKYSTADKIALALCVSAIAYCLCGASFRIRRPSIDLSPVPRAQPTEPDISGAGFAQDQVYTYTAVPRFTGSVKFYGSWQASKKPASGSAHSAWFQAVPRFAIFFAGYPNHSGNQLFVEVETEKSGVVRLPVPPELIPGETWWLKEFSLPRSLQPLRFRIGALSVPVDSQSWLGFSQPFVIRSFGNLAICEQLLLFVLGVAAAMVAFLAPGLMLRQKRTNLPFIFIPVPGIMILTLVGLLAWIGPSALSARSICRIGLGLLVLLATYRLLQTPLSRCTTSVERQVFFVFLLLVAIGSAKSIYSFGPAGELYAGRVSRTLEPGWRSDSRVSYHAVQLVQFRLPPFGSLAREFYFPWNFSHRGPIPSLAISPIVLSGPVRLPPAMPDQPWTVFDPEGFAAYRIGMIVLACCGLLAVFGLATLFLPDAWALFAFLVAVTAPFSIHEIYFTWPKLASAGFALIAAYLVFRRKYLFAGLALGFGYLVHPSALMSFPALAGIILLGAKPKPLGSIRPTAWLAAGLGAWLLFWRLVNSGHYAQDFFLEYFRMTAGGPGTLASWLHSRFNSVMNALVPLYLFFCDPNSTETRSAYGPSPTVTRFFFLYWNTLPFGAGIAFFLGGLLRLSYVGYRKARAWLFVVFLIPLAFFFVYWGISNGGIVREGLHAWFLGSLIFAVVIWHKFLAASDLFFRLCNGALLFRGIETLCMMLLPGIASQHALVQLPFVLSDTAALAAMFAATGLLYGLMYRLAERLRRESISARS